MRQIQLAALVAALAFGPAVVAESNIGVPMANAPFSVNITVDAGTSVGELTPIWRYFGADEANYAYMKDGRKLACPNSGILAGNRFIFAPTICSRAEMARTR
jgi:xylan 1,4-beta-xylosidase